MVRSIWKALTEDANTSRTDEERIKKDLNARISELSAGRSRLCVANCRLIEGGNRKGETGGRKPFAKGVHHESGDW